jgi:nucleoside-diphosphate-sugar epimerase
VNVLVLGGSVFVGRRLVAALADGGHDVTVLNRGVTPSALPPGVAHLAADRTDMAQMRATLGATEWDAVFDVSGFVMAAGGSDINGLLDLLDGQVGHHVFVSSIMAYDQSLVGVFPWTEDLPTNADGPSSYGGFKALAEAALLERFRSTGYPVTIVRPAAIYGPDNNIYDMETPMFLRLLQHRPILVPHGGLVAGSYGHVDDLATAMVAIVERRVLLGEVVNVTTDSVDVNRYVATLAEVVGEEPVIVPVPDSLLGSVETPVFGHLFGRRHHAILATGKARAALPAPTYDLASGHRHTYEWFLARGWADRSETLVDPVWRASWDFEAEAAVAEAAKVAAVGATA